VSGIVPHAAVHRPWAFICGADPDDSVVSLAERPAAQIASALLEDVGDWHRAVEGLQHTEMPPAVSEALSALHEAVCGWTDWNARKGAGQ
jgi:hypothetical protein